MHLSQAFGVKTPRLVAVSAKHYHMVVMRLMRTSARLFIVHNHETLNRGINDEGYSL